MTPEFISVENYSNVEKSFITDDQNLADGIYFDNVSYRRDLNINSVPKLNLDKIVLVENRNINLFDTVESNDENLINHITLTSKSDRYNINSQYLGETNKLLHDRKWRSGYFKSNVLLSKNYSTFDYKDKIIKSIVFNYSRELARRNDQNLGKLSLKSVQFLGKREEIMTPRYQFDYFGSGSVYTHDDFDLWGYYLNDPKRYTLKSITTPIGTEININYERDDFETILFEGDKMSHSQMLPKPISLEFKNSYDIIELEMRHYNPCFEIGELYSCLEIQSPVDVHLKKAGYNNLTISGTVLSTNESSVTIRLNQHISSHYDSDFYVRNYRGSSSGYWVDLEVPDCNSTQSIGKCDDSRGGLRVKSLALTGSGKRFETKYEYLKPNSNLSSGMTTYTPYLTFPSVANLIPTPGVIYSYVTVKEFF